MPRKKLKTITSLRNKLTLVFNRWIRLRDTEDGWGNCISCLQLLPFEKLHAGHYFPKSACPAIRFDEDNVHGQGACCNTYRGGNLAEYTIALEKKIGRERLEVLRDKRFSGDNHTSLGTKDLREWYLEMIEQYKI